MSKTERIQYYASFDQDFAESKGQDYKLPKNYKWIHKNPIYRFFAACLYPLVVVFTFLYIKLGSHTTIKNRHLLYKASLKSGLFHTGFFVYSNHTQLFGDVVNPFVLTFPTHPYIICSPSNLGIPRIGKMLPMAGALPIPDNIHDMKKFTDAINVRIKQGNAIIIYPEGHLWPWHTKIRPFAKSAFHHPAANNRAPVYVATTTYKKSIFRREKPKITIYIDGPFRYDQNLTRKENMKKLEYEVRKTMERRAKHSTYEYVKYIKKSD